MDSMSISFRAFERGADEQGASQRADLPVLREVLTPSDPPQLVLRPRHAVPRRGVRRVDDRADSGREGFASRADPNGWTCATDSVRAQLDSVIHGLPPPRLSPARVLVRHGLAPEQAAVAPAAPAPGPTPAEPAQQLQRLDAERERQMEQLTRRAETAEAKVRALEAQLAAEQRCASALVRRFGQQPHELFPVFVARLGMTAKAVSARGARGQSDPMPP